MHTYLYRLNTLFTIASTTLAVICVATSLTDWTIRPDPKVKLAVQSFDGLQVCTRLFLSYNAGTFYLGVAYCRAEAIEARTLACRKNTGMIEHG